LRDTEVEDLDALAARELRVGYDEDVVGFEIAVRDADGLRRSEDARDLATEIADRAERESARATDPRREGLAVEKLHDQVRATTGVDPALEDLDGPGMLDLADRAGLVEEPLYVVLVLRDVGPQQLDGHFGVDRRLFGQEHLAHAASAQPSH